MQSSFVKFIKFWFIITQPCALENARKIFKKKNNCTEMIPNYNRIDIIATLIRNIFRLATWNMHMIWCRLCVIMYKWLIFFVGANKCHRNTILSVNVLSYIKFTIQMKNSCYIHFSSKLRFEWIGSESLLVKLNRDTVEILVTFFKCFFKRIN